MKKLKLVFDLAKGKGLNEEAKCILKNSKRKYENIEFRCIGVDSIEFYLEFLAERAGSWKSATISCCTMKDEDSWTKIFSMIESSVEELLIEATHRYAGQPKKVSTQLKFPRLKSLVCRDFNYNAYANFLNCQNLVKFHWELDYYYEGAQYQDVLAILRNNHGLKYAHANTNGMSETNSFRFKLRKLRVSGDYQRGVPANLFSFLKPQAETLESLDVHVKLNRKSLELILTRMPRLKSLKSNIDDIQNAFSTEDYRHQFSFEYRELPANFSITSLTLKHRGFNENTYKTLTRALRSLQHFKTDLMDCEQLLLLARNVPELKSIKSVCFRATDFPQGNIFPQLQKFKVKLFTGWVEEPTGENNFAAIVAKEMRRRQSNQYDSETEFYCSD